MVKKEGDFGEISYILGIISVVNAFFIPLAGFVFGVIGFIQSKKENNQLSKKAKKLNVIGIILSIIMFIITVIATTYLTVSGLNPLA